MKNLLAGLALAAAVGLALAASHHHQHHPAAGPRHGTWQACTTAAAVPASSGAGIQGCPVRPGTLHPGSTYKGHVYVTQGGSGTETLRLYVQRLSPGHGTTITPSWFTAPTVTIAPGQGTEATFYLTFPAAAKPGRYFSDIVVAPAPAGGTPGGGAALAGAATTKLIFRLAA